MKYLTPSSSVIQSKLYARCAMFPVYYEVISLLVCANLNLEFLEKAPRWILCSLGKRNNVVLHVEWVLIEAVVL